MKSACDCGGTLREVVLDEFDFTPYAGVPSKLVHVRGVRCDKCGYETVHGREMEQAFLALAAQLEEAPERLNGPAAAFLRRRLDMTQKELSARMGMARESVARWERSKAPPSTSSDYILRGVVLAALEPRLHDRTASRLRAAQARVHARLPRRRPPFIVDLKAA
jgi:putative zinc finger/helix-turn-helix YgiT family protein